MPRRTCPTCLKRLPYAGRRCVHCGWTRRSGAVDPERVRGAWRRRQLFWGALLGLFLLGGGGLMMRNAPVVADWYAGFAAEHLAQPFSSFAPRATDTGAYFYCARHVARSMEGDFSVETFPSVSESTMEELGERRVRITSFVLQARADGASVRHDFACTVRHDRGRWVMEDLSVEQRTVTASATDTRR